MSQYDPIFDLKINVGQHDLYFTVQWFCLISWRLFDVWTSYFGIMIQYDPTFDLNIIVGHSDLLFMAQWFCLISWSLFEVWTSYFGLWFSMTRVWPQNKCCSVWSIFHGSLILPYIFDVWTSYFRIISQYDPMFDLKINVGHCDIFHGPVILPYILKTVWYMNIILWDYESIRHNIWPQNKYRSGDDLHKL